MIKRLIKFLLFLTLIVLTLIAYLSFIGISTNKFNDRIRSEVSGINQRINIDLKNVKFLISPLNLSINVQTFGPKVFIDNNKLELEYIKTNISLKSFINKEFSIDDLKVSTKAIKLNNLILLTRSFNNSAELFILDNFIKDGFLVGDINLNFDDEGKIKNDYEIKGHVKRGKIDLLKKYSLDDLNFIFNIKDKEYHLKNVEGIFNQIRLSSPLINIKEKNNQFFINGKLISKKDDINIKKLDNLLKNNLLSYGIKNITFSSENDFDFILNKKLKIKNLGLKSKINLNSLVYKNNRQNIKKYLPNFKELIKLENHQILINYKKNLLDIKGDGELTIEDKIDKLDYHIIKKDDQFIFDTNININKNPLLINFLQYEKKKDLSSNLKINGIYEKSKKIKFRTISFKENKSKFLIKNLDLNKNFKILDIEKLVLDYVNKNKIRNQIDLKKNKKEYKIYGKSFDASKLIDQLLNSDNEGEKSSSIFSNLNSNINIEIIKTYLDEYTFIKNLSGKINFKKNKINKLNLKSFFPNNKKLTFTINTNKNNEKITTLFSDYPKPLVKQYKFIKGFEEGVLDFYSIKKKDTSNSILKIDNFKLQEVPALAKILTLASLQGIADLLTGEGIRFTDFEMRFSNKKGLMTIEEMYAIGPAISILMDGYIETKKLISLRGTLVPATTINRTIASIPFIGNILVGKKVGEGVFGVSFKVKGSPKDIKTSVNPIKTLTPRFITRTLEKIKKN